MDRVRVHLIIEGRVQGVWFRESTRREAVSLRVYGWVKNLPDGTVEALIEGPEDQVKKLVSWCHEGPPSAKVTRVRERPETWQGEFSSFDIAF
ncbi:MAG: acylphosphatase [Deltaproteobacteria bacterium]|nr:acylphosphatase [Deltaproteobacteria bacterium]MBW2048657.1 acylphosphatase [Deltaproteobacteria bacterium]MBW2110700.1 acylphosphatase [Deltaproteobacteria bacterium]MBW2351897.1 acylphosphatase [Deltaproteobacteria bacterium]HDZ89530.1 acylphosphatase [Deltaproteobacteria bacterium]